MINIGSSGTIVRDVNIIQTDVEDIANERRLANTSLDNREYL